MTFADIPAGIQVFVDANTLVYHFLPHATFVSTCTQLLARIGRQELSAFTSTHVLSEVAHRIMTVEASAAFGWTGKIVQHLKLQPSALQNLLRFQVAIDEILQSKIQILTISPRLIATAAALSRQTGLLSNDALIVAVMQSHGLTSIASNDLDFDRVPGLTRYAPA